MEMTITNILTLAVQSIRRHFAFYAAITLLFYVCSIAVETLFLKLAKDSFLLGLGVMILSTALYVKQAVVIHRSVIVDEVGQWNKVFTWGRPDNQFLLLILGLGLLFMVLVFLFSLLSMPFVLESADAEEPLRHLEMALLAAYGLLLPLVCLMLPSRAVEKPLSFEDSYRLIKPVYFKALVLMVAVPWLTALVFEQWLVSDSMPMNLISNLVYQLVWVFEVTVLSHTYDVLIRQAADHDPQSATTEVI